MIKKIVKKHRLYRVNYENSHDFKSLPIFNCFRDNI